MKKEQLIENAGVTAEEQNYHQSVVEFLESVVPYLENEGATEKDYARLERLLIPERIVVFKVVWEDDAGTKQHNLGYRVQFNSVLGPYKGGLRFDSSVNPDILKFLGFEQIFKNALTGLPLGGGKGGSDFNPKGKSDREIQRFCVAFMTELVKHIGPNTDVPAGDIGVSGREIGYLYGAYKRLTNRTDGVITGKGVSYNGSNCRIEATGYGAIYFIKHVLEKVGKSLKDQTVVVSGSGNVATNAAKKAIAEGATVLTLSDRGGYLFASDGFSLEIIEQVIAHKANRKSLSEYDCPEGITYREGTFWSDVKADIYIPCATQNEVDEAAAQAIVKHGALLVAEGANMPLTLEAIKTVQGAGVLLAPAKATNAGGVAVSGLEMSQNAGHRPWTSEQVDSALRDIMEHIHDTCVQYGKNDDDTIDYVKGANIGGFVRVFRAMEELGW